MPTSTVRLSSLALATLSPGCVTSPGS